MGRHLSLIFRPGNRLLVRVAHEWARVSTRAVPHGPWSSGGSTETTAALALLQRVSFVSSEVTSIGLWTVIRI